MEVGNKTYFTINYGCQMNESDTEHYAGQLLEMGYRPAGGLHQADVIIINTCCIRESAEKKIAGKIGELKAIKSQRPDTIICVAGCMAQKDGEKLQKKPPQIDLLLGTGYVNDFKKVLSEYLESGKKRVYMDLALRKGEFEGYRVRQSPFSAWIPIMYGCNNFCTYCIVPYVRGRERSRSAENIIREVEEAVAQGYKEFTLLGQNVNSYGKDRGEREAFAELLRRVDAVSGVERLHYMTSHPRDMSEAVIRAVAECRNVCESFHVPFQAGSSRVLRAMNRGYSKERYLELISMIRSYVPDAAITTDIIVGFPGETEADFLETMDVVEKVGFNSAYTFIYSKRSGTPAADMDGQVPLAVKKERLKRLMELQNEISLRCNERLIGKSLEVLAEGPSRNPSVWMGRSRTGELVLWNVEDKDYSVGQRLDILVDTAQTWLVKGKAV